MKHTTHGPIGKALVLSALLFGLGCGSDKAPADGSGGPDGGADGGLDGGGGANARNACTRDAALLDARTACRQDDQCPCGAYCSLGLCTHDCRDDADCAGWCDDTGRCRAATDTAAVARAVTVLQSRLALHPAHLVVHRRSVETVIRISAPGDDPGKLRLEPSKGLLVDCQGTMASECELDGLEPGRTLDVKLKIVSTDAKTTSWQLTAFFGQEMRTVSIEEQTPPESGPVQSGVYRGTAWTEASALALLGSQPLAPQKLSHAGQILGLPIELRVFDDGTLVFLDRRGVLPSVWKFRMKLDGTFSGQSDGDGDGARGVYLGNTSGSASETSTEVTITATGALSMPDAERISGTLATTFGGLGLDQSAAYAIDERPVVTWGLSLERQGPIAEGDASDAHVPSAPVPLFAETADRYGQRLPWDGTLASVNLLDAANPGIPSWRQRMEYFLCYQRNLGDPTAPTSKPFGTEAKTLLLDYVCADLPPANQIRAFPFFSLDGSVSAGALLNACLADLDKTFADPPGATCGESEINCLTGDTSPRQCVDAPLVLRALGMGFAQLERLDWPAAARYEPRSDAALRLAHRVLQQWIELHTFVAREATQANDLPLQATPPSLTQALAGSLDGWNVVLHPAVVGRLMHYPPALLRDPDYRTGQTAQSPDFTQRVGLPVAMLEAMIAQADAATALVRQNRMTVRTTLPSEVVRTARSVVALLPLARLLNERANLGGAPPWADLWQGAEHRLDASLRRFEAEWDALDAGANPLGIEDADLPLYHSGQDAADAIDRFKAISNYLLAAGGGATDPGWATRAVAAALTSADKAQAEWGRLLERKVQQAISTQARADRVAQIKQNYGEKLLTLCGERMFPAAVTAEQVVDTLAQHPEIDAYSCFMDQKNAACRYDEAELVAKLEPDDMAFRMCVLGRMQQQFAGKVKFKDDFANDFVAQATLALEKAVKSVEWYDAATLGLYNIGENVVNALKDSTIDPRGIVVDGRLVLRTRNTYDLEEAEKTCQTLFPKAVPMNKLVASLDSSPLDRPDCYHGSMGELALAVRSAAKDIEVANQKLQELADKYQIALNHCIIQESALSQMQEVNESADQITGLIGKLKATSDGVFRIYDGAIGCFTGSGWDTLTGCANSVLKTASDGGKDVMNRALPIGEIQTLNRTFMTRIRDQMTNAACFNDAEMHLVGTDTQARQIEKSRLDLSLAMLKLRNAQETFPRLVAEANARVVAEQERAATSLVNDTWQDLWDLEAAVHRSAVEDARRDLEVARRATYLAVRAVEYEWQMSLMARAEVLRAAKPSQFADVLEKLRTVLAPNKIAGQSPKNANVVLSLKQQVLQLASMDSWPEGQPKWSDTGRLRLHLTSSRLASFDDAGQYRGQFLPVSIAPLGVLGLGKAGSAEILTGADCAERIWKVNVVLQGENLVDDGSTKTRIDLLQKNVFHSQWCTNQTAGASPLQSLSVRPSRNLFLDPVWGAAEGSATVTNEADKYLRAAIDAYHNITRTEFELASYQQGASMELACRGLYGDFALFFPKETLALDGRPGLHLENIEDILLRFDYVSVTKSF